MALRAALAGLLSAAAVAAAGAATVVGDGIPQPLTATAGDAERESKSDEGKDFHGEASFQVGLGPAFAST